MAGNTSHERNLLFAGLGLQLSLLTKEQLVRAFSEWILNKTLSLGEILVQQGAIKEEQKKAIEGAIDLQIQSDGGEVQALASVKNAQEIETSLKNIEDQELEMTLCTMNALQSRKIVGNEIGSSPDWHQPLPGKRPAGQRFQRSNFLDAGSLGEIWFAKDDELNRTVVLKYIKGNQQNSPFTRALFNLEGEVTGYLEHPAVVPVYSMGQDDKGRNFYAMRYIHGRKLTRAIADYHALPATAIGQKREALTELLLVFQTACLAIEYAHSKGVLHCDLKPDNIVVGPFGETLVIDWGLAMVTNPTAEMAHEIKNLENIPVPAASGTGAKTYSPSQSAQPGLHSSQGGMRKFVGGTPAYMSPEQMRATRGGQAQEVTHSCDIFSLGATLYHLLTSRAPFIPNKEKRENYSFFVQRIEKGGFPVPRQLNPGIPNPLEAIVLKAMAAQPENRYGSARELADEVKRWLADEPVHAYMESVVEKTSRWARNHRTAVVAATVLLLCLAFGGVGISMLTQSHYKQLQISEKEARSQESLAKEQRGLAEKREEMAIAAVKQFADAVEKNSDLKNRPDLEPLRKDLLKEPIHFFKDLSAQLKSEKNPSPKSLNDLAKGLSSLAFLTAQIGNGEDAIQSYKEAINIQETLVKSNPANTGFQSELARLHNNLSNMQGPKEAEPGFQKALAIQEGLIKSNPANPDFQSDFTSSLNNFALLCAVSNRPQEAEASYKKAVAIQESLVMANPNNTRYQNDLARSYNNFALLYRGTNRPQEAETCYKKAIPILESLVKANPTIHRYQSDLASFLNNLGVLYTKTNRQKEAGEIYLKALAIREALAKANPTIHRYQSALIDIKINLAAFWNHEARLLVSFPLKGEEQYQKGLTIAQKAVNFSPENGLIMITLGIAQYRLKQFAPAFETLLKSNQINSKANEEKDPSGLAFLAMTCHQLNKKAEAEKYFKELEEAMKEKHNNENPVRQFFFNEAKTVLQK